MTTRFVHFLLVGALNTAVGYGLFMLGILSGLSSPVALLLSTTLGVLFNYFSTGRLVFAWRNSRRLWRFMGVYAALYTANAWALITLEKHDIPALWAQALLLPAFVLLAFMLNSYFVFRPARIPAS